ncbi:MAG: response regulator [Alphaproteobacteria bacterium]|jgi:two-component system, OmpR family, response regulator|nr:response regulator [Alphaproteobacteria bacterium]
MSNDGHLLIVDDDPEVCASLESYLSKNGYQISILYSGEGLEETLDNQEIDLVILDLMLPGRDGLELTNDIRRNYSVPVIMLTGRGDDIDRIIGLEMGADDYLPKPFNPRELLARIRAVLKRSQRTREAAGIALADESDNYSIGELSLETGPRRLISGDGKHIPLTDGEYQLLLALVTHPDRVLSRDFLLDVTRDREFAPFDRSIDIQVSRLRRKIEPDPKHPRFIRTVRNGGYMYHGDGSADQSS